MWAIYKTNTGVYIYIYIYIYVLCIYIYIYILKMYYLIIRIICIWWSSYYLYHWSSQLTNIHDFLTHSRHEIVGIEPMYTARSIPHNMSQDFSFLSLDLTKYERMLCRSPRRSASRWAWAAGGHGHLCRRFRFLLFVLVSSASAVKHRPYSHRFGMIQNWIKLIIRKVIGTWLRA